MKKLTLCLSLFAYSTVLMAQPAKPDISIVDAAAKGNLEKVKAHLTAGTDINDFGAASRQRPHDGCTTPDIAAVSHENTS